MPCIFQQNESFFQIVRFHKQVVAIESRNHEYTDLIGRERLDNGQDDARFIEGKWPL
jgi:hypothetical protein